MAGEEGNIFFDIFGDNDNAFDPPTASPPGSPVNNTSRQNSHKLNPLMVSVPNCAVFDDPFMILDLL